MHKEHVMIDIETLGTSTDCIVLSVGAVYFDENGLGEEIYQVFDTSSQFKKGRKIDPQTLSWWSHQMTPMPLKVDPNESVPYHLLRLMGFIREGTKVWALGPTFDMVILESLFKDFDLQAPWKFWNVRDVRTVVELFPECRKTINNHNALDDAKNQAEWVIEVLKQTKTKGK